MIACRIVQLPAFITRFSRGSKRIRTGRFIINCRHCVSPFPRRVCLFCNALDFFPFQRVGELGPFSRDHLRQHTTTADGAGGGGPSERTGPTSCERIRSNPSSPFQSSATALVVLILKTRGVDILREKWWPVSGIGGLKGANGDESPPPHEDKASHRRHRRHHRVLFCLFEDLPYYWHTALPINATKCAPRRGGPPPSLLPIPSSNCGRGMDKSQIVLDSTSEGVFRIVGRVSQCPSSSEVSFVACVCLLPNATVLPCKILDRFWSFAMLDSVGLAALIAMIIGKGRDERPMF